MRVLVVVPSDPARLHALVPLGWGLRTGGAAAQLACRPGFAADVNRVGFVAVPVGADGPDPGVLADERAVADLVAYASRWRPDVVVWDATAPAGAAAARALGVPDVAVVGPRDAGGPRDGAAVTLDLVPPSLRGADGIATDAADGAVRPLRFVPYAGPAVVPSWLRRRARRPRVFVAADVPPAAMASLVAAASSRIELVCVPPPGGFPAGTRVPAGVRVVESAPSPAVLPTCAAVAHGGALVLDALAAGLPQLVCLPGSVAPTDPLAVLAARVADAGAGLVARPAVDGAVDGAVDAVAALVAGDASRSAAERIAAEIAATPGPPEVVRALADPAQVVVGSAARA